VRISAPFPLNKRNLDRLVVVIVVVLVVVVVAADQELANHKKKRIMIRIVGFESRTDPEDHINIKKGRKKKTK